MLLVLVIVIADTVDHAVELANDTTYTLAASVWATDMRKALEVSRRIRACKPTPPLRKGSC